MLVCPAFQFQIFSVERVEAALPPSLAPLRNTHQINRHFNPQSLAVYTFTRQPNSCACT